LSEDKSTEVLNAVIDEISVQIKKGNRVFLRGFGMFYPKKMRARKIKGGLDINDDTTYMRPACVKIGFSSSPTGDRRVTRRRS
jgi:nucleoid DNA-binding protein